MRECRSKLSLHKACPQEYTPLSTSGQPFYKMKMAQVKHQSRYSIPRVSNFKDRDTSNYIINNLSLFKAAGKTKPFLEYDEIRCNQCSFSINKKFVDRPS